MTISDLDDDQLLARLSVLARRIDPVPPEVAAAARGGYTWRTVDLELAELVYDSALDLQPVGVRSGDESRHLTFASEAVTVEVEIAGRSLVGQLVPPQPAAVEIRHPSSMTVVPADHLGRFTCTELPSGPMSIRCRPQSGAAAIATDWLVV